MATAIINTNTELFSQAEAGKFDMMARALSALERQIEGATVARQEDANNVQRILAESKRALKTCDETRLAQTKPLREQQAAINDTWGRLTAALQKVADVAGRKILVWNDQERQRRFREERAAREAAIRAEQEAEAARKLAEQAVNDEARQAAYDAEVEAEMAAAQAQEAVLAVEQAPRGIKTDSGTTSTQWRWTFRVEDPAKVPRQYLTVDEKALRAAIAAGITQIDGVTIWQEEVLRTVTR